MFNHHSAAIDRKESWQVLVPYSHYYCKASSIMNKYLFSFLSFATFVVAFGGGGADLGVELVALAGVIVVEVSPTFSVIIKSIFLKEEAMSFR